MSRKNMRQKRRDRRKPRMESLESRRLLTTFADVYYAPANEFTVRRDEVMEVDLTPRIESFRYDLVPSSIVEAAEGEVTFDAEGSDIQYRPKEGFIGVDVFTIGYVDPAAIVADGDEPQIEEVRVAVNVINPVYAVDDWFQIDTGATEPTQLDVLENDIFLRYIPHAGPRLAVQPNFSLNSVRTDGDGSVSIDPSNAGMLVYTPASDFSGVETIHYTAVGDGGYTTEGTAEVRVSSEESDSMWPEQLQQSLLESAVQQNQYRFAQSASNSSYPYYRDYEVDALNIPFVAAIDTANDFSGTNNQLSDVDESDRIKSDGEYLYVLSKPDANEWFGWGFFDRLAFPEEGTEPENVLTVVDIRQADAPVIVSRQILADKVESLDLYGDRLTVIGSRDANTVVSTLDVSDPTNVSTVSTTVVDGYFRQARRVGETLYLFTNEYGYQNRVPDLETHEIEEGAFSFYESAAEYVDRVSDQLVVTAMPSFEVYDGQGELVRSEIVSAELDLNRLNEQRLNIVTIDTASDAGGVLDWDVNLGGDTILVTSESIYVTQTNYSANQGRPIILDDEFDVAWLPVAPTVTTEIDRYELADDGTVDQSASGSVPGTLKNSFSLDEHDGMLRIATENSRWTSDSQGSSLYVLQQADNDLSIIGGVTGLAPGEQIYAVRFAGDRGYVVTFRRVDPLFVVDLSDPTDPQVQGELKVPGYSQYLHVISEDHVLGVGRDADENTGQYAGLTVSLFNVSDPLNPTLQDRYLFDGGRTTFSPFAEGDPWSLRDHHAISYFADSGVLALPFYSTHGFTFNADQSDQPVFENANESAVRTFQIDPVDGISVLDTIPFESRADRTLRVGEHLLSMSPDQLKVTNLLQPDGVIATLDFEREGVDDFAEVADGEGILLDVLGNDGIDNAILEILATDLLEGAGEIEIVNGTQIRFKPEDGMLKPSRVRYTARDAAGTLIDAIATIDADLEWQNVRNRLDTNNDGNVTPVDAVIGINTMAEFGFVPTEELEAVLSDQPELGDFKHFFVDTNNDGQISPSDVISQINFISASTEAGGANIGFELDQTFDLAFDDIATLNSGELVLAVSDLLEDSSCPTVVTCFWEGRVRTEIDVTTQGETETVELAYQASQEHQVEVAGYAIEFVSVTPRPELDADPTLQDYTFTVLVSQLG